MLLECRFQDTEVDGSNPAASICCVLKQDTFAFASVDSAVK